MTTPTDPKPKPTIGRPRKAPGAPKSRYKMTEAARKARSKGGRAHTLEHRQELQRAMMRSQAARMATEGAKTKT